MKAFLVASAGALSIACLSIQSTQAGTTPGAAIFTNTQAQAGAKTYAVQCSKCHGAKLEGVSAPALRGSGSGLGGDSVSEAYTFMSTQMPAGNPGSLSDTDYVNVLAYILSRNGHAAGAASLTPAAAKKSHLKV